MGKGGSRLGAGRPGRYSKTDRHRSIDVRRFAAENMLRLGMWSWHWRDGTTGEEQASISVIGRPDSLVLAYETAGEAIRTTVHIERTPCRLGGSRPWFSCPHCGRRVAVLYMRSKHFACRHCHRLAYGSQAADKCGRSWRKQRKLEARLGPNWQRPKHMHAKTYAKLMEALMDCERQRDEWLAATVMRLMGGLEVLQKRFPKLLDG